MSPGIITVEKTFYICSGVLITRDNEKTLHKAKEPIRLRGKKLSNGNTSLFLDIYRDGRRSKEYLKLYLIPGKDAASKLQNEETLRTANAIKAQRVVAMQNNEHGFANPGLRAKVNFLDYLEHQAQRYKEAGSRAYARTVRNTIIHLTRYAGENITIGHVDKKYLSGFIDYLNGASSKYYHTDKDGTTRRRTLSQASRALYFNAVVIALNRAVKDDIIPSNPAHKIPEADRPKEGQATKEYLTLDEVQKLEATPCKYPELKRAFLFSCFCGLRMSDVRRLRWQDIHTTADGQKQVETVQQKTGEPIYIPLSNNALRYLPDDSRSTEQDRIFILPHVSTIEKYLSVWGKNAGITKHLTYHVSRHTNATLMLTYGADIYTVSKLLGHTNVKTTAVYAKIVDENKRKAVNLIPDIKTQGMEG